MIKNIYLYIFLFSSYQSIVGMEAWVLDSDSPLRQSQDLPAHRPMPPLVPWDDDDIQQSPVQNSSPSLVQNPADQRPISCLKFLAARQVIQQKNYQQIPSDVKLYLALMQLAHLVNPNLDPAQFPKSYYKYVYKGKMNRKTFNDIYEELKKHNYNPIFLALASSDQKAQEQLAALLQEPMVDVNARDSFEYTPLMVAAGLGNIQAVHLLLHRSDLDINAQDGLGYTAAMHASARRHFDIFNMLHCHPQSIRDSLIKLEEQR